MVINTSHKAAFGPLALFVTLAIVAVAVVVAVPGVGALNKMLLR